MSHRLVFRQLKLNAKWVVAEVDEEPRVGLEYVEDVFDISC